MDFNFFIEDRLRSVAPRVNCPSIGRLSAARESIVSAHDEIMADRMGFKYGAPASLRSCCSRQSSIDRNSSDDQAEDDCREQQQPAPILARLAQSADEMSAIAIGDSCDDSITSNTADSDDCQKSPEAIVRKGLIRFSFRARPSYPNSIADLCTWLWSCVRRWKRYIRGRSFSPNASGNREPPRFQTACRWSDA
jgi:hypothetical protein